MVKYTQAKIREVIVKTFEEAQHTKTCHRRLLKNLKKIYEQCDLEIFVDEFIRCLKHLFPIMEKHPRVENSFDFAAKFAVALQPEKAAEEAEKNKNADNDDNDNDDDDDEDEDAEINPFLKALFEFCLAHHAAVELAIRYRICFFMSLLLSSMSENAYISDDMCDKIRDEMSDRLLDKSPKVRVQAIGALHRMQDPGNSECPVIKLYIYHMGKDGSAEVRKAAIQHSAKNLKVLEAVLKRICDIDESVRKTAYVFFSQIKVKSLTIKQRQLILNTGLNDPSENVRKAVQDVILKAWLRNFEGDYCKLLYGLDTEMQTELGVLVLNTLFEQTDLETLFKQLPLDRDRKLIPIEQLNGENILYWRCFIEYLHKKSANEALEESIPELTSFCKYIRDFQSMMLTYDNENANTETREILSRKIMHQFIHLQLFELVKTYDLSDEVGRGNLRELIEDTLMIENYTVPIIESIVKYYEKVVPDVSNRLTSLAHVISEIRMPTQIADNIVEQVSDDDITEKVIKIQKLKNLLLETQEEQFACIREKQFEKAQKIEDSIRELQEQIKTLSKPRTLIEPQTQEEPKNDSKTMTKCLTIMYSMVQASSVKTLTATLRSLFDNLALPSIDHNDGAVQILALKALGVCLHLDEELAKKHLMVYLVALTIEHENIELWLVCLSVLFDMFLRYGLDHFANLINADKSMDDNSSSRIHENSKRHGTRLYSSSDDTGLTADIEHGDNRHLIKILLDLIYHKDSDIRTNATTGFCKLLLHGKLKNNSLLSSLIIRLYDPATEADTSLRSSLLNFFKYYPRVNTQGSICLQQIFLPTLRKLIEAPDDSPLSAIDPYNIAKFIIDLSSIQFHAPGRENYTAHNLLAFDILREIVDEDSIIEDKMLIKSLKHLNIRLDNDEMKTQMREDVDKVLKMINPREKSIINYLENFKNQFDRPQEIEAEEEHQNIEPQKSEDERGDSDE